MSELDPETRRAAIDLAREADFDLGAVRVRPSITEVAVAGRLIRLQPRVMQVLVALVRARGEVVSRDDLIASCWGGLAVGEDSINRCIQRLRRLSETEAPGGFTIETLPRIGYRLWSGEPADPADQLTAAAGSAPAPKPPRLWLLSGLCVALVAISIAAVLVWSPWRQSVGPPMRSVAVLPIQNLTGDASLDAAVDRLTQDANYVIGRGGYDQVPSWNAIFAFKNKAADARRAAKALHVRYLVTASLRKAPPGYRLSLEMVDAATGKVANAKDLGRSSPDGSLPEGALALALFNNVAPEIDDLWLAFELKKPPDDSDLQSVLARQMKLIDDNRPQDIPEFEHLLGRARALLPRDNGLLADAVTNACEYYTNLVDAGFGSPAERAAWDNAALGSGQEAAELRPNASGPHACRSQAFSQLQRWDDAMAEARHVIEAFPLTAQGYRALARAEFAQGQFADALRDYSESQARDGDNDPTDVGVANLFLGHDETAAAELLDAAVLNPKDPVARFFLAAALQLTGRHDEALQEAALYRKLKTGDGGWTELDLSHAPAFVEKARVVRKALHDAGLDEAASP